MRVLHAISNLDRSFGGPAPALAGLARAQAAQGLDVSIAVTWHRGHEIELAQEVSAAGVRVERIGPCHRPMSWSPAIAPTLRRMLGQTDIVHIHALFESVQHAAAKLARSRGVPYVISVHGMLDPWSLRQKALKKKLYLAWRLRRDLDHAAAIHYTAAAERDLASPVGLCAPTLVIPNGIDLAEFDSLPPRGVFRRQHPGLEGKKFLLFLGRIHPKKGFDLLIPALGRLGLEGVVLVIAGPDREGYLPELRRLIAAHGVADRVLFAGMLRGNEKLAAFVDADLFVLPSYSENFGIAVVEALAAGVPVVVSDRVNIHREITAAGVGQSVPLDADSLAAALSKWLGDDALRRAAGARAIHFARENYDWNKIAGSWVIQYESLVAAARARR